MENPRSRIRLRLADALNAAVAAGDAVPTPVFISPTPIPIEKSEPYIPRRTRVFADPRP
jgi:hypothetical protein